MMRPFVAMAAGLLLAWTGQVQASDVDAAHLIVQNPGEDLSETPIVTTTESSIKPGTYRLLDRDGKPTSILADVITQDDQTRIAVLLPQVAKGETRYKLDGPIADPPGAPVKMNPAGNNLEILVRGEPFTTYAVDLGPKPVLYPLLGPSGSHLTRSYPMEEKAGEERDHPHHRSFWFTHGEVNGIDFWSEAPGHGTIRETSRQLASLGQVGSVLSTTDAWVDAAGKTICTDERTLRVYAMSDVRMMDFEVKLIASEGPLHLGDTKEGTFAVRVASTMDAKRQDGGQILNAEGLRNTETWGKRSRWVDYTGPVDGRTAGITILDHPQSHAHPTPWHVRDYGLFAANPFGFKDFGEKKPGDVHLEKGKSILFLYRVILHDGNVAPNEVEDAYRGFAKPPVLKVEVK